MNVKRTEVFEDAFGDINPGEAFSTPYGRTIYVKTDVYMRPTRRVVGSDRIGSVTESVDGSNFINAIDLSNGMGRYFRETEFVVRHEGAVVYSEE